MRCGAQWKTHILCLLGETGPARFGELRRRVAGISPKVLAARLRELAGDGLIWRDQTATIPPQVTYGLTPFGDEVTPPSRASTARAWVNRR